MDVLVEVDMEIWLIDLEERCGSFNRSKCNHMHPYLKIDIIV